MEKNSRAADVITLFLTMLKIGAFTFGGGYAMIALLENEYVSRKKWLTKDEFLDMVAIAESTPGPVAINSATYIGYKIAGVVGSVISTIGMCLPSFAIIYMISLFFEKFLTLSVVSNGFRGISFAVVYLIFTAGLKLFHELKKDLLSNLLFLSVLFLMTASSLFSLPFSSIAAILICGTVGLVFFLLNRTFGKGGEK